MRANYATVFLAGLLLLAVMIIGSLSFEQRRAKAEVLGDANCDGAVNSIDSALMLQSAAGFSISFQCPTKADVNSDGSIGPVDAALVLQYSAGLIDSLGASPTATPTRTRTPAATATTTSTTVAPPTATPTRTMVPTPSGPVSAQHVSWYLDSLVALRIVGELHNGLDHEAEVITITASLYSASNVLLDTAPGYPCVTTIAAGADSPFTVRAYSPPQDVDHVTVHVSEYYEPPANLFFPLVTGLVASITDVSTDSMGRLHTAGTVTNNSANDYDYVRPCVAHYNAAGDVVRVDLSFTSPRALGPGDEGAFESVLADAGTGIVSQRVWVNALYAD